MEFNDGQPRKVLVADSIFRGNRRFGTYYTDVLLPKISNSSNNWWINKDSSNTTIKASTVTDEWLNNNMIKDPHTSKYNCDVWMKYKDLADKSSYYTNFDITGVPAVEYCRLKKIDGKPLDLPNINILMRIYCDAEILDSMDPTIILNNKYALGSRNPQGAWYIGIIGSSGNSSYAYNKFSWSSTNGSNTLGCWDVGFNSTVDTNYGKCYEFSVIPILEII